MLAHDVGLRPAVRLSAHLARGVGRVATDAVLRGARSFPRHIDDLDAAALSRIMGRPVTSLVAMESTAGTTSRARLKLSGDDVPESVFLKMSAGAAGTRLIGELGRLAETEVRFYSQLSAEFAGAPTPYGSAFDPLTGRFVLVLEDLAAGPCEFPDTLHPFDKDRAGLVVELLAGLHARFWARVPGWLHSGSADPSVPLVPSMLRISARRLAQHSSIEVEDGRYVIENYPAVAKLIDAHPHTVLHGDPHPGNTYFRIGKAGLLDWQAARRGHVTRDLAYTLITGMTTTDRQTHERRLLDDYRQALAAAGGPHLDRDDVWTRYRQAAAYAYVASLVTAGLGGMQAENIAAEGLRLAVAALNDLDTIGALREAL